MSHLASKSAFHSTLTLSILGKKISAWKAGSFAVYHQTLSEEFDRYTRASECKMSAGNLSLASLVNKGSSRASQVVLRVMRRTASIRKAEINMLVGCEASQYAPKLLPLDIIY